MKTLLIIFTVLLCFACGKGSGPDASIEMIPAGSEQDLVFKSLIDVTNNTIPETLRQDSLAFLVLPVQASCPSCREKTIDSIVKHQQDMPDRHFVIISARGGRKTIGSYFEERDHELPTGKVKIFLDSTDHAGELDLYKDKPTMYYTYQQKAYKKVSAIPSTVRNDLREFFLGYRQ